MVLTAEEIEYIKEQFTGIETNGRVEFMVMNGRTSTSHLIVTSQPPGPRKPLKI
jgi:hypothetical protein